MERLTKRAYGEITYSKDRDIMCGSFCNGCSVGTGDCDTVKAMVEKLAELEDLEEQGLLLRLPCRPNDIVYRINKKVREPIIRMSVERIVLFDNSYALEVTDKYGRHLLFMADDIGKVLYITREEAEAKLKEMEESYEGK